MAHTEKSTKNSYHKPLTRNQRIQEPVGVINSVIVTLNY